MQFQLDNFPARLISRTAARVARHPALSQYSKEDLQQELALDHLQRFQQFDPLRCSAKTFSCRLIRNRVASLIAEHSSQMRNWRLCTRSLNEPVHDDG
jgi:DNA-directed RNA polymerase specialized sigma24 family protein